MRFIFLGLHLPVPECRLSDNHVREDRRFQFGDIIYVGQNVKNLSKFQVIFTLVSNGPQPNFKLLLRKQNRKFQTFL